MLPLTAALVTTLVLSLLAGCDGHVEFDAARCQAGALDKRFCDANGNLVADPPADLSRRLDPETLIFAFTPVEDPTQYREVWLEFLEHMQKVTGRKVQFFPVQSNAAQIEAMRAGRLHIAGFNTGSLPLAVNCAGFVPFAMMAGEGGSFGYEMELITHVDSGIERIEDLKGRTLAFTSPTSNSGFKAPSALLRAKFGFESGRDFQPAFSGRHDNSLLGVINRDYEAAAVANQVTNRLFAQGIADRSKVRVLYTSETFPTTGFGVTHALEPALASKVREGFLSFPWKGSALAKEFPDETGFIPISYQEHWSVIRQIDTAFDVTYSCR
ncbi:MAG: phosphate/phosphite/phosphonate ABC transporter substrate-binding protein [Bradymonadaceae bacterium]|nr:phosphate/phosphite/phosphonate ABC transporter substrate-binding protein [Lujinxingiaceae bacterium]